MIKKVQSKEQETKWPSLSEKVRDRRWGKVRKLMRERGLDCAIIFGLKGREQFDQYMTNDRSGGILIFPLEGEPVYLVWAYFYMTGHMESALRGEASWIRDMRPGSVAPVVVEVLREKGYDQANIGVVGIDYMAPGEFEGWVPYKTWTYILNNLPHAKFQDISVDFAKLYFVKDEEELQLVRRAAEIGELAAEAMLKATRPGVPESEIYVAAMDQLFLNGANGSVSPYLTPMILHSGPDNTSWAAPMWLVRAQPPRVVQRGDLVQAEIFPRYGGMEAQVQMSVAIKPVDPVNTECAAIARRAYEVGLKALRPGKTFGEVVEALEKTLIEAKAWWVSPLIHSLCPIYWVNRTAVGIEKLPGFEKYKQAGPTPVIGGDLVLQPGMTWELEPNACIGKHRVNIGGTVIITEEGAVGLNVLSTEMRVVG